MNEKRNHNFDLTFMLSSILEFLFELTLLNNILNMQRSTLLRCVLTLQYELCDKLLDIGHGRFCTLGDTY